MNNLSTILEAVIASKTEIDIIYQGGSKPGALRTILPLSIKDGLLKAKDIETSQSKSYKLELISLPEDKAAIDPPFRIYHSLHDLLLLEQDLIMRSELLALADRFHIRLFRNEKDSVSAAPLFFIGYQKYRQDSSSDPLPNSQPHKTENPLPWICNGTSYGTLQQAAETFVMALRLYVKK